MKSEFSTLNKGLACIASKTHNTHKHMLILSRHGVTRSVFSCIYFVKVESPIK